MAPATEDRLATLLELLERAEHGRQELIDALWANIPAYVAEYGDDPSSLQTTIKVNAQTRNLELIKFVMCSVPSGQTGEVQLGPRMVIPVPAGLTVMNGVYFPLSASDTRQLVLSAAGDDAFLYLSGEQLPLYGKIR